MLTLVALAANGEPPARHVVLQFDAPLSDAQRAQLASEGVIVGRPIGNGRFVAIVRGGSVRGRAMRAEEKLHRTAKREAERGAKWAELNVIFHDDVAFADARAAIEKSGGVVAASDFSYGHRIAALMPSQSLQKLANEDAVFTILGPIRLRPTAQNANSAALSHVTELFSAPYSLDGSGITLSLMELADPQSTHPDFGGRLTSHTTGGSASDAGHATHVAGTIGGSGLGSAAAKGMAPAATLHLYNVLDNGQDWVSTKAAQLPLIHPVADNNSWGYELGWQYTGVGAGYVWPDLDAYFGAYDLLLGAPLDKLSRDENILFVSSAGNDGTPVTLPAPGAHYHTDSNGTAIYSTTWCYSTAGTGNDCPMPQCSAGACEITKHFQHAPWTTIGITASAKNVVTVGAVGGDKALLTFSSRGPARDGRVKPELVARGYNVYSTMPTDTYGTKSGTSMAAPVVTGIAGLLAQQWKQTFSGASAPAVALKTLMIAGAEDLGNAGPDYAFGFGLVNAQASADLIRSDNATGARIRTGAATQSGSYEYSLALTAPMNLRVVLGWADPEIAYVADELVPKALVNDLDLTIIGPDNAVTSPYVLDANNPTAIATRGTNNIDNTEEVEIANAAAGTYRIVVTGTNIAASSPQSFVVVANGPVFDALTLTATGSATPSVALSWNALSGASSYDVVRNGTTIASGVAGVAYNDASVSASTVYVYRVIAHVSGFNVSSNTDLAITSAAPASGATIGGIIRLQHITELQSQVNLLRTAAGLGAMTWTTAPALNGLVRASQVNDLRAALLPARANLGLRTATIAQRSAGAVVRAADLIELRDALR
ncbi:MAG TPA: S8 family serine peptidase [Thermoanaerobaculia bacterium]|nr:S8 family serine peptidase [Thermoanaerobaculia bacterium]